MYTLMKPVGAGALGAEFPLAGEHGPPAQHLPQPASAEGESWSDAWLPFWFFDISLVDMNRVLTLKKNLPIFQESASNKYFTFSKWSYLIVANENKSC